MSEELTKEDVNHGTAALAQSLLSDEMLPEAPTGTTPNPMLTTNHHHPLPQATDTAATMEQVVVEPVTIGATSINTTKPSTKRWTWKKPAGKPNRPLSAYNLFFADVRASLETPLDFVSLASHVAKKWHDIDETTKTTYQARARVEKEKYQKDIIGWKEANNNDAREDAASDSDDRPSKKLKSDCANCPVCLAKAQNNSMEFDGPYYIISCSKEFARQLANADIPGFQASFVADPSANATDASGKPDAGFDYAAAIEEALQVSAEPALDRQDIDKLMVRLEEQRSLAAVRQHTQQLEYFEQNQGSDSSNQPASAEAQEDGAFTTTELVNEATTAGNTLDGGKTEEIAL